MLLARGLVAGPEDAEVRRGRGGRLSLSCHSTLYSSPMTRNVRKPTGEGIGSTRRAAGHENAKSRKSVESSSVTPVLRGTMTLTDAERSANARDAESVRACRRRSDVDD